MKKHSPRNRPNQKTKRIKKPKAKTKPDRVGTIGHVPVGMSAAAMGLVLSGIMKKQGE